MRGEEAYYEKIKPKCRLIAVALKKTQKHFQRILPFVLTVRKNCSSFPQVKVLTKWRYGGEEKVVNFCTSTDFCFFPPSVFCIVDNLSCWHWAEITGTHLKWKQKDSKVVVFMTTTLKKLGSILKNTYYFATYSFDTFALTTYIVQ